MTPALNIQSNGDTASVQSQGDPLGQLAAINQELIRRRQTFTDRDPSILALTKERDALRRYIENTAGGSLALPNQSTLSKEQAQEIVIRYQELERKAKRDTATLNSLENTLLSLQLEEARITKPWELISIPTVLDKPVSPKPARNLAIGLLAGLVLGGGAALVAERRSDRVFAIDELRTLLPGEMLAELKSDSDLRGTSAIVQLLADGPLAVTDVNPIALIPAGNLDPHALEPLRQALETISGRSVLCSTNLVACRSTSIQLLITSPGAATRTELAELRQQLQLQGTPVAGWLLLKTSA